MHQTLEGCAPFPCHTLESHSSMVVPQKVRRPRRRLELHRVTLKVGLVIVWCKKSQLLFWIRTIWGNWSEENPHSKQQVFNGLEEISRRYRTSRDLWNQAVKCRSQRHETRMRSDFQGDFQHFSRILRWFMDEKAMVFAVSFEAFTPEIAVAFFLFLRSLKHIARLFGKMGN